MLNLLYITLYLLYIPSLTYLLQYLSLLFATYLRYLAAGRSIYLSTRIPLPSSPLVDFYLPLTHLLPNKPVLGTVLRTVLSTVLRAVLLKVRFISPKRCNRKVFYSTLHSLSLSLSTIEESQLSQLHAITPCYRIYNKRHPKVPL